MTDTKADVREAQQYLDGLRAKAKTAWDEFDAERKSARAEGVNLLAPENADAFTRLDEKGKAYDGLRDAIADAEAKYQTLVQRLGEDMPASIGEKMAEQFAAAAQRGEQMSDFAKAFTSSETYKALAASGRLDRMDLPLGTTESVKVASRAEAKTLLTTAAGGAALFRNDRKDVLVNIPQPPLNILDVIPMGETDSDTVEWVLESTFTNAAVETSEGTAASESTLAYSTDTRPVQEVTHFLPATKKMLADAAQLESLIRSRLVYGVQNRLQSQVVNGNGTSPNLRGIVNTVGILTQARGTDSRADAVHKAITKVRVQAEVDYVPQFILIHPTDWETVTLEKTSNGDYYYGGPAVPAQGKTIWGLTPIISTAVTVGTPIVLDINQTMLWLREGISVAASDSHSTFFTERKVALLASMRAAFGVLAPKAVCTVTSF